MLQNYYEGKIVKLYIRERLFAEKMHQKNANAETLCIIWFVPFVLRLPSCMSNHDGNRFGLIQQVIDRNNLNIYREKLIILGCCEVI